MKVLVTFEKAYAGRTFDAVWIIDSAENRAWFERQAAKIDVNSAIFNPAADPQHLFWSVFEHHPRWTEIVVRGIEPTSDLAGSVPPEAILNSHEGDTFSLVRT